ncbi:unnamed protein product [Linum tenue]|uniref:Uncharacterized protein n=1 Tax=Linum tenue TaxID=586396 RepID=A0AAV0KH99_9ROSI|nr:unnamed protein product [Linum tenue]
MGRRARVVAVRWGLRRQERDLQPTKLRRMDQNQTVRGTMLIVHNGNSTQARE